MKMQHIAAELDRMGAASGIAGCALVAADTGLVWHASSNAPQPERIWEAAIDYWRLHDRQKTHFEGLGTLAAAMMYHTEGVLAVLPCSSDPELVVVSHSRHQSLDWPGWQKKVRALGRLIAAPDA
jgi:hypothetical protein